MNTGFIMALLKVDAGDGKFALIAAILILVHRSIISTLKQGHKDVVAGIKSENKDERELIHRAFEQEINNINKQHLDAVKTLEDVNAKNINSLVTQMGKGACNGDTSHCRYQSYFRQSIALSAHIEVIKVGVVENFARDLQDAIENGDVSARSSDISIILACHYNLVKSSFAEGVSKLHDVLHDEIIPRRDSSSRIRFVNEKAKEFNAKVWGYYGKYYIQKLYLLSYQDRKDKFEQRKSEFIREFSEFIDIAEDISKDPYGRNHKDK